MCGGRAGRRLRRIDAANSVIGLRRPAGAYSIRGRGRAYPARGCRRRAEGSNRRGSQADNWLVAEIRCRFELAHDPASPREEFGISFPVFAVGDPPFRITEFNVTTDGRPTIPVHLNDSLDLPLAGEKVTYVGYVWRSPAPRGPVQKITVEYKLLLPVRGGEAFCRYVVRSGGAWSRPIGLETVTVRAQGPLLLVPCDTKTLQPVSQEDGSLVWTLRQARPLEDVMVMVKKMARD